MQHSEKVVVVTGANGFIGSALLDSLSRYSYQPRPVVRDPQKGDASKLVVGEIDSRTNWVWVLSGVDAIVHLAARVHYTDKRSLDPLVEYRRVNVAGTLHLAREAASAGVRRFIYLSSIKVNGAESLPGAPLTSGDIPAPVDPYGISKFEAEQGLLDLAKETGLEVVIIRPVLVYGPGVKANFLSMMCWLQRGIPLPLGGIHNKRSLVGLDNLLDLIITCIDHPAAIDQIFLVSDDEDLATPDLLKRLGESLGKPARLLPVPTFILQFGAKLLGKQDMAQRLCGSLQVDISRTRKMLDWTPPVTVNAGLRKTAECFLRSPR